MRQKEEKMITGTGSIYNYDDNSPNSIFYKTKYRQMGMSPIEPMEPVDLAQTNSLMTNTSSAATNAPKQASLMPEVTAGQVGAGAALGAVGGLVGGIMDYSNVRAQNSALNSGINSLQGKVNELAEQRKQAINARKSEATDFLTQYVTTRDPNRSQGIAQMYSSGNERLKSELASNDTMQANLLSEAAKLKAMKQDDNPWNIATSTVGGAAQSAASLLPMMLMG